MKTTIKIPVYVFMLFFVPAMLQLTSCQSNKQKTQEKIAEEVIENATGQKTEAEIDGEKVTIEGENYKAELNAKGGEWSDEIPKDVPEFNYGTISHSTVSDAEGTKSWGYIFKGVTQESVEKYNVLLKKNGFKTMKMTMDKGGSLTGEKDNIVVSVIWSDEMTHVSVQVRNEESE
jgi:hypothetical protein